MLLLPVAALLSSCASSYSGLVLPPVGPSPEPSLASRDLGTLIVYSAYDVHESSPGDYEHRRHYTDYKLLASDGKLVQKVHNDSNNVVREPAHVKLPPGNYQVVAESNGYGTVRVPVVIVAQRSTRVHLEGQEWGETTPALTAADAVRLPDGRLVGWRSQRPDAAVTSNETQR